MRIAIASLDWSSSGFTDDELMVELLRARTADASIQVWDDESVDWHGFDLVVIRSTWDYSRRRDEFIRWAEAVGERLENPVALVSWNIDKRYLGDLAAAGLGVVETSYVAPGEPAPAIERDSVIKPTVSAAGRDTGRFGPDQADRAEALIAAICASGRTAMVQPYHPSVDTDGEIGIVFVDARAQSCAAKARRAALGRDRSGPRRRAGRGGGDVRPRSRDCRYTHRGGAGVGLRGGCRGGAALRGTPLYARVDQIQDSDGAPVVLELEAIEPSLYLDLAPGTAERLADAIIARAQRS